MRPQLTPPTYVRYQLSSRQSTSGCLTTRVGILPTSGGDNVAPHAAGFEGDRRSSRTAIARARRASVAHVLDLPRGIAGEASRGTLVRRRRRARELVGVERRRERTGSRVWARLKQEAAGRGRSCARVYV